MTSVYITIDTEYSSGIFMRTGSAGRRDNFARSILGQTDGGDAGILYQMDVLDRHGLKAVFFVDPMPALVWGVDAIADVVGPILDRGHDVQLHIHTEWLAAAGTQNPLGDRTGHNIKDFSRDEQRILLDYAMQTLMQAGAPQPVAFRAGNYGANDDTLHVLGELGIRYDSSHCPGISDGYCAISLSANDNLPVEHCGLIEVPVAAIATNGNRRRHAQITALTAAEMIAAIRHAKQNGVAAFTLVSHSFELLSRDRSRINPIVRRRFERLCAAIAAMDGVDTATYRDAPPRLATIAGPAPLLPHSPFRTVARMVEQAVGNALYGAR